MSVQYGKLYLIPNILSEENTGSFLAEDVKHAVHHLKHFIVESEKTGRALIKKLQIATPQQELYLRLWNEHSKKTDMPDVVEMLKGNDVGIISEAGLPCVADPGSDIVAWAHNRKITIVPLPGASSLMMALMASGFNGQSFVFHGYLPIDKMLRVRKIKEMEGDANKRNQSQIFMEAPYRNNQMFDDLVKHCLPGTRLCVASEITSPNEFIRTCAVKDWPAQKPELHKKPVVFILG